MTGDASARQYQRLIKPDGSSAVLMISPPRVDPPTLEYATPYSTVARLAEDIKPFLAVGEALVAQGFSAPKILASDARGGLAALEDLGTLGVVDENGPIPERYMEAVALLADMHGRDMPTVLPLPGGGEYRIPPYDSDAYRIEAELLVDWYALDTPASMYNAASRAPYADMWLRAINKLDLAKPVWVLRDYHSPNIIWLPRREGLNRVGIIDFQDCLLGHPAYDVVSLAQDARVTVPDDLELRLLSRYAALRKRADPAFDMAKFAEAYAVLGAQRAAKILGVFARLEKRDMKPQYLAHIPRVEKYMAKNLAHPALAEARAWIAAHVPTIPLP
jgi:aminoglycoside/choline kinase family phosphotransferase